MECLSAACRAEAASGGNTDQARGVGAEAEAPEGAGPLRKERHVAVRGVIRMVEEEEGGGWNIL